MPHENEISAPQSGQPPKRQDSTNALFPTEAAPKTVAPEARALKLGFPDSTCYKLRVPEVQTGVTIEYKRSWRNW